MKINLDPELLRRITADRARLLQIAAAASANRDSAHAEIAILERVRGELTQRAATLAVEAVGNDHAAGELLNVERRAAAVRSRLESLRSKPLPQIDLAESYSVIFLIVSTWQHAVQEEFERDVEHWDIGLSEMRHALASLPALTAAANVGRWVSTAPAPSASTLARVVGIYDRALRGQVDLSRVSPPESGNDNPLLGPQLKSNLNSNT